MLFVMEQSHILKDFGSIGCFHTNFKVYTPPKYDQATEMGWKLVAECSICKKRVRADKQASSEQYIYDW